jgi:hypothetical protein
MQLHPTMRANRTLDTAAKRGRMVRSQPPLKALARSTHARKQSMTSTLISSRLRPLPTLAAVALLTTLTACGTTKADKPMAAATFSQINLPTSVQVPAGHQVALETVGKGDITYECRAKKDMAGQFEWVFVGPAAKLMDRSGKTIGRYFGPPATWAANDGSAITGTQVAVAPASAGSIPLQLVKANAATSPGAMQGVSYIQRVATQGGVAPAKPCAEGSLNQREVVGYQADYVFWKAN